MLMGVTKPLKILSNQESGRVKLIGPLLLLAISVEWGVASECYKSSVPSFIFHTFILDVKALIAR